MRFQDWDALLFPGDSQTPVQEFRTACFALQDARTHDTTPLLCAFVPSLPANAPFQISIHAWNKTPWILGPGNGGYVPSTKYLWQVKIVSDGHVLHVEEYPEDKTWPLQIGGPNSEGPAGKPVTLLFPPFHKDTTSQPQWYAAEDRGRVKVTISAGYNTEKGGKPHFVKLVDHVVFSFQPAPLELLQKTSIAWPNANLTVVTNPLVRAPNDAPIAEMSANSPKYGFEHRLQHSGGGLPEFTAPSHSSRSTSTYTAYPVNPPLQPFALPAVMPHPSSPRVDVRLHSDQLRQIVQAISSPKPTIDETTASMTSMPPPPLPLLATVQGKKLSQSSPAAEMPDRRNNSRFSDISMHPGCEGFPACTTEDAEGHIVHQCQSAAVPTTVVIRGRKEGSTPSKPNARDFMSTVMDRDSSHVPASSPVEEGSTRKKTRYALKSMSINDGSPEKKQKPRSGASRISSTGSDKENMMVE